MATLDGRIVLITGAAGGIGAASARRLSADGARLVLADLDGGAVEKLAKEIGHDAVPVSADVTRQADIEVAKLKQKYLVGEKIGEPPQMDLF